MQQAGRPGEPGADGIACRAHMHTAHHLNSCLQLVIAQRYWPLAKEPAPAARQHLGAARCACRPTCHPGMQQKRRGRDAMACMYSAVRSNRTMPPCCVCAMRHSHNLYRAALDFWTDIQMMQPTCHTQRAERTGGRRTAARIWCSVRALCVWQVHFHMRQNGSLAATCAWGVAAHGTYDFGR